jgi:hypothetical protein
MKYMMYSGPDIAIKPPKIPNCFATSPPTNTMHPSEDAQLAETLHCLYTMPLTEQEYATLASCRRVLVCNAVGLAALSLGGSLLMVHPSESGPHKSAFGQWTTQTRRLARHVGFATVGACLGLGLGVQYVMYRLSAPQGDTGMAVEVRRVMQLMQLRRANSLSSS